MWEVRSSIVPARVVHGRSTDPEKLCLTASTPGSVRWSSQEMTSAVFRCEKFAKNEAKKYWSTLHLYAVNIVLPYTN